MAFVLTRLRAQRQFLDIVEDMNLSEIETAALRLAIARDDDDIRAALEVFRLENDTEDLMDTLRRIAARVVRELGSASTADIFPARANQQDADGGKDEAEEQEVSDQDQLEDDSEEDGEAEEDADDEGEGDDAPLVTEGARREIFLVGHEELWTCDIVTPS